MRSLPGEGTTWLTRCADQCVALSIFVVEAALVVSLWIGQPIAWLWVASQVDYLTGSLSLGLLAGLIVMVGSAALTLAILLRLDHGWKLARRAAGRDQRDGALERLCTLAAAVITPAFLVWLLMAHGPRSLVFPFHAI
jgi:hypothetical protein